ncbi:intramolecular oxidoreductase [Aureococcus anophagefferens]|nr:intramolecular oxidoreductase [Aureococcus anophagefferens]
MASRGRQFSVLSTGALNTLDNLTAEIDGAKRRSFARGRVEAALGERRSPAAGIEARIVAFEKLDPSDEEKKLNALGEIRQICGDLDKIQATKVGAPSAAVARANHHRRNGPAVLVYPPPRFVSDKYEKKRARYPSAKLDADALKKFLFKKAVPLVGQKTWKSNERYEKQNVPVVTLFAAIDLEKNPKGFDYFANRLRKVAADFVGKLSFNIGDKEDFSYQLEDYELVLESKKDVGVGARDGDKYYHMTEKFNVDNLRAFAQDLVDGKLTPKIKEEPDYGSAATTGRRRRAGADYEGSDVTVLTTDNFEDETAGKDAMLEFYAPWCGHCQQLKPTYKQLGEKFAAVDSVVIGAMDATANEPPKESGIEVQGYPTLIFKKADGSTEPYDGDRDLDSMVDFIVAAAGIDKSELEVAGRPRAGRERVTPL